ncbi:large conductance mechanosensitive channel protein MscL [Patescibacteria group bacterium]|nr:large conductance mechanosensitive channel protein MscL [Patescibacteria group bacterium]
MSREKFVGVARGFMKEFKSFAIKGNAFELAIAVVIGTSFTAIINALVGGIITPLLGFATGGVDFKELAVNLRPDLVLGYGLFLQSVFNFLLVSLSIFIVFKMFSAARKRVFQEEQKPVPTYEKPAQERLLEEIRDLLKTKN